MRLQDVEAILRALNDANARFLVVGGLAVVAHGYVRLTVDVDIVVQLEPNNVLRAMTALDAIGYRPLIPVRATDFANEALRETWRLEKNMLVFQLSNPDRPATRLDIFVYEPFNFDEEYSKADQLDVAGIPSPVLRLEALLKMKTEAGRPRDLGDVGELRNLMKIRDDERAKH